MEQVNLNKRCDICNKEISKSNWSKHIKTKKHLRLEQEPREINEVVPIKRCDICNVDVWGNHIKTTKHLNAVQARRERVQINHCGICNVDVLENERNNHLKSPSHKRNTKLIKNKLKEKVRLFKIRRLRKRNFDDIDFETDDYIVKKSEEALEKCFLTIRITPKNEVNSVDVLMEELPGLMFEKMKDVLEQKTAVKLQIVLRGNFRKFQPATGGKEFEEITVPSKNQIILREDEIDDSIGDLLRKIHEKIESWDNNEGYWHLENVINVDFKLREYKPLSGSSYIELPKWIYNKKKLRLTLRMKIRNVLNIVYSIIKIRMKLLIIQKEYHGIVNGIMIMTLLTSNFQWKWMILKSFVNKIIYQ
jgi:hypothetical protein